MLTLYYTQALLRDLRDLGYHQLALPVVAMQQLIADSIFDNAQLKKVVHLRYTWVVTQCVVLHPNKWSYRLVAILERLYVQCEVTG